MPTTDAPPLHTYQVTYSLPLAATGDRWRVDTVTGVAGGRLSEGFLALYDGDEVVLAGYPLTRVIRLMRVIEAE